MSIFCLCFNFFSWFRFVTIWENLLAEYLKCSSLNWFVNSTVQYNIYYIYYSRVSEKKYFSGWCSRVLYFCSDCCYCCGYFFISIIMILLWLFFVIIFVVILFCFLINFIFFSITLIWKIQKHFWEIGEPTQSQLTSKIQVKVDQYNYSGNCLLNKLRLNLFTHPLHVLCVMHQDQFSVL